MAELYPDTQFIEKCVGWFTNGQVYGEGELELIRAVCVTEELASGNGILEHALASLVRNDTALKGPAASNVDCLFAKDLGINLAWYEADNTVSDEDLYQKGHLLHNIWEIMKQQPNHLKSGVEGARLIFGEKGADSFLDATSEEREPTEVYLRHVLGLGRLLLCLDAQRLENYSCPQAETVTKVADSTFRKAVLDRTTKTGVRVLDEAFRVLYVQALQGYLSYGLSTVSDLWLQLHSGQNFYPQSYLEQSIPKPSLEIQWLKYVEDKRLCQTIISTMHQYSEIEASLSDVGETE